MLLLASGAQAQSLAPRSLFIDDRGANLFDTEGAEGGIRAGLFDVRAALGLSFGMDSNVYAAPEAEEQGLATGEALLRARKKTETRDILGLGYVRARRFEDARDQDATEYGAVGRYDAWIDPQNRLTAGVTAERNIESRADIETPTDIALSPFNDLRAGISHLHVFNRFALESSVDGRRVEYEADGQSFRDRWQYRGELRGIYRLRADFSWIASAYYNRDEFDDASAFALSAETAGGLLGLRFDVPELLEMEVGAGYFERRYLDSPAALADTTLTALEGVALRGSLRWFPTRLTTVRAQLLRSDAPTRLAGSSAKVRNDASLGFTHEYSRNLLLHAGARYIADDFEDLDRLDEAWLAELGMTWGFGRHSVLRFQYDFATREHASLGRGFDRHVLNLAYIARL